MRPVDYDDLSEHVQQTIAELEIKVIDLEFEARFWRVGSLLAVILFAERAWRYFFP